MTSIKNNYNSFQKSQLVLLKTNIETFPIDMIKIIEQLKKYNILLTTVAEYEEYRKITKETKPYIKIKDGRTYFDVNRKTFLIVYNDKKYSKRVRFTLAHELAHIVLNHLNDSRTEINRGGLTNSEYAILEGEANTFAGNFLAPPVLINEIVQKIGFKSSYIEHYFGLSASAVRDYRKDDYLYWRNSLSITDNEMQLYKKYVIFLYPHFCDRCRSIIYGNKYKYCLICGSSHIKTGKDDSFMKYTGIDTYENGKAKECAICHNDETDIKGDYCQICGTYLLNQCASAISNIPFTGEEECTHTEILPSNARYCPYCGNKTTFLENGLLKDWNYRDDDYDDIPDELPFF